MRAVFCQEVVAFHFQLLLLSNEKSGHGYTFSGNLISEFFKKHINKTSLHEENAQHVNVFRKHGKGSHAERYKYVGYT